MILAEMAVGARPFFGGPEPEHRGHVPAPTQGQRPQGQPNRIRITDPAFRQALKQQTNASRG